MKQPEYAKDDVSAVLRTLTGRCSVWTTYTNKTKLSPLSLLRLLAYRHALNNTAKICRRHQTILVLHVQCYSILDEHLSEYHHAQIRVFISCLLGKTALDHATSQLVYGRFCVQIDDTATKNSNKKKKRSVNEGPLKSVGETSPFKFSRW